ncbi:MAG TPA: PKD domain-containing protein, partial [Humisphaera sp.]
ELKDGAKIELATVGTRLNVRAVPTVKVGSVVFKIDGRKVNTESYAPYALGGNSGNDYRDWTPPTGRHTLQVTLYDKAGGQGTAIATRSIGFTVLGTGVVDPPPVPPPPTVPPPPPPTVPPPPPVLPSDDGGSGPVPGTVDDPGSPTAVIKVIGQSGVAGHPVVVDAVDSDLPNSPLYARYQWDFGDPDGRYNRLPGWTGGHVYDEPGTYTVRLTVTDGNGNADSAETTITVLPDDRRTVYVDAEAGSDANDGSAGSPIRSFEAASRYAARGNVRVLFRRGQRWDTRGWMSITGDSVEVGAYGEGANPVLSVVSGKCAIRSFDSASNLLIEGLTFDSPYTPVGATANKMDANGIYLGGTGVAVRDCTFLNVTDGINSNAQPHGLIVMDNDAPSQTGIRGYFCWTEGTDVVLIGNSAANSTREHIVRIKDGNKVLLAYNDFTNLSRESVDKQDIRKGCIEMQRGSWAYIYGNTTRMGPIRVGPRGQDTEPGTTTTRYAVVENNKIYDYKINLYPGAQHVMIRDNVMYADNAPAIALNPVDPQGRRLVDINILDNVAYNSAANGQFLRSGSGLLPGTVTVGRNTYVAPNLAGGINGNAGVYVLAGDLSGFKRIFDNTWPLPATNIKYAQGGVMWVANGYTGQAGFKDPTEWLAYPQVDGDVFKDF